MFYVSYVKFVSTAQSMIHESKTKDDFILS